MQVAHSLTVLPGGRNGLVGELGGLAEQRESLAVEVPVELLRYVDEGGNPDVFTAETFRRANRGNQLAKGRVQAFAQLRCVRPHPHHGSRPGSGAPSEAQVPESLPPGC